MPSTPVVRRLLAVAVTVAVTAGLAGCEDDVTDPTGAVAFVVGARSNMPSSAQLDGRTLAVFDEAVVNQSLATIVVADGNPELFWKRELLTEGANNVARQQSREENRRLLADALAAARADDPESDLLAALDLGARSISSVGTPPRTVVVVDSGLSTTGSLDFTQPGLLQADPQEVADSLARAGALPDLAGLTVVWQGLGDTWEPQERLDIAQRENLIDIWTAVIEAAGGALGEAEAEGAALLLEETPLTQPPAEDLPPVTPVPVPTEPECTGTEVVLDGGTIPFLPDSAEFRDRAAAEALLGPIAEQMIEDGLTATLTGTTANVGDLEGQRELSLRRAEAVRDLLVGLGVPADALEPIGVGSQFPGYVQDRGPGGSVLPGPAAQNRKVIIVISGGVLDCG